MPAVLPTCNGWIRRCTPPACASSRGEDGRLGFERTFKFEYSYDGIDRHVGRMVLRGDQLISFTGLARRGSARSARMWTMPRMCKG